MSGKVLIVDDDADIRHLLRIMLQNIGYQVEEGADGLEGLQKVFTFCPDAIILDLQMPILNGYQVCRLLKSDEFFHAIPVIILTASSADQTKHRSLSSGADYYHVKPIQMTNFSSLVKKCIADYQNMKVNLPYIPIDQEIPTKDDILIRTNELLDTHLYQLGVLEEIGVAMTKTFNLEKIFQMVINGAQRCLDFDRCWIALVNEEETALVDAFSENYNVFLTGLSTCILLDGNANQPALMALSEKKPIIVHHYTRDERFQGQLQGGLISEQFVDMPLVVDNQPLGIIRVDNSQGRKPLTHLRVRMLQTFTQQAAVAIANARLQNKEKIMTLAMQKKVRELEALRQASQIISSELDIDVLLKRIIEVAQQFFHFENCAILIADHDARSLQIKAYEGDYLTEIINRPIPIDENSITGSVARHRKAINIGNVGQDKRYLTGVIDAQSELAVPLISKDKLIGVFNAESQRPNAFSQEDLELFQALADQAALAIQNSYLVKELERLAVTDNLTGLRNRTYMVPLLHSEIERADRYHRPLSIIFIDVDCFKNFNKEFGYLVGDEVLVKVASLLQNNIRSNDTIARWGGEEFLIVLPETDRTAAFQLAERLRKNVEGLPPIAATISPITISGGVLTYPQDATDSQEIIKRVDDALVFAKNNGRNQIIAWDKDCHRFPPPTPDADPDPDNTRG